MVSKGEGAGEACHKTCSVKTSVADDMHAYTFCYTCNAAGLHCGLGATGCEASEAQSALRLLCMCAQYKGWVQLFE